MDLRPRHMYHADLVLAAEAFLSRHHRERTIPIPIETMIELGMGIDIIPCADLLRLGGCDAFPTRDGSQIWVEKKDYIERCPHFRFTLAEEASHITLHGDAMRRVKANTLEEVRAAVRDFAKYPAFDKQAKTMAALVLIPPANLHADFPLALRDVMQMVRRHTRVDPESVRSTVLRMLATKYEVTQRVMRVRIDREDLWRKNAQQLGFIQVA
jgi:hypothetical protein